MSQSDSDLHEPDPWPFGDEEAAKFIARTAWVNDTQAERWGPRLLREPEMLAQEARRARGRLEAAIKHLEDR